MAAAASSTSRSNNIFAHSETFCTKAREITEDLTPILSRIDRVLPQVHDFEQDMFCRHVGVDLPENFKGTFYMISKVRSAVIDLISFADSLNETFSSPPEYQICLFESMLTVTRHYAILESNLSQLSNCLAWIFHAPAN